MSPSPQLAPPGSSSYGSNTMTVGDGTWDATKNTFLLPNLMGLNLATTQYNGMGNRFRELPQYHNLIRAHGVIAAITFLLIVPSAIMILRFYGRNPRMALRYHIWLQILTVLLSTVVFILGWMAVGPRRSLTNPHHGIGLAIYVLIWFQAIGGWWVHHREKKKRRLYEPLKVMIHHWIGRTIALLGLAQIPLGLALYGSPVTLFILYALAAFALLATYFILTYLRERRGGSDYDSRYSYGTGSVVDDRGQRRASGGRTGTVVKGALAGAGGYWLLDRIRGRRASRANDGAEVVGSHRPSGSYVEDEKYSQYGRDPGRDGLWEDRLLRIAAPIGLAGLAERYLDRRHRDRDSDTGSYGPPLGGPAPINDGRYNNDGRYMDGGYDGPAGRPPPVGPVPLNQPLSSHQHPLNQPLPPAGRPGMHRAGSASSYTHSSFESASGQRRKSHGLRDGLATLGALGLARSIWNRRKSRKEDRQLEDEQDARAHGNRLTGDGQRPRRHRPGESTLTSDTSSIGGHPAHSHGIPPIPAGVYPAGGAGVGATAGAATGGQGRPQTFEELPLGGIPRHGQVPMPQIPPDRHGGLFHDDSSGSEVYIGGDGRNHWRHHAGRDAAAGAVTGGAAGLAAAEMGNRRRGSRDQSDSHVDLAAAEASSRRQERSNRRQSASGGEESMAAASTPVSVKVKMHNDGRHVTLRRLPEAEAAAEREARRAAKDSPNRRRNDSVSTLSGTDGTTERFRRNQMAERQRAEAMRIESERLAEARSQAQAQSNPNTFPNVAAPPPIPGSSSSLRPPGAMSVGSPGTYDGNTTEASADYANNRRRRRAERAQAKQAREAKRVEFEE